MSRNSKRIRDITRDRGFHVTPSLCIAVIYIKGKD